MGEGMAERKPSAVRTVALTVGAVVGVVCLIEVLGRTLTPAPSGPQPASPTAAANPGVPAGRTPPEFPAAGTWIRPASAPDLTGLRGRVVFLRFSFLNCAACKEMAPHLVRWHRQYGSKGLEVVEVDDGSVDSLEEVRAWCDREQIPHPVYYDSGGAMTASYRIRYYPSQFILDRTGNLVWHDEGAMEPGKVEGFIKRALGTGDSGRATRTQGEVRPRG
jgi:thiol-disulfide isomerase/thioredoxin